jgi:hypothetical protein
MGSKQVVMILPPVRSVSVIPHSPIFRNASQGLVPVRHSLSPVGARQTLGWRSWIHKCLIVPEAVLAEDAVFPPTQTSSFITVWHVSINHAKLWISTEQIPLALRCSVCFASSFRVSSRLGAPVAQICACCFLIYLLVVTGDPIRSKLNGCLHSHNRRFKRSG